MRVRVHGLGYIGLVTASMFANNGHEVVDSMPGHVVDLLRAELGNLDGTAVAVLGISYKGNIDDTRNSPGLAIGRELGATVGQAVPLADGRESPRVDVRFHDPCVSEAEVDLRSLPDALRGADAAIPYGRPQPVRRPEATGGRRAPGRAGRRRPCGPARTRGVDRPRLPVRRAMKGTACPCRTVSASIHPLLPTRRVPGLHSQVEPPRGG